MRNLGSGPGRVLGAVGLSVGLLAGAVTVAPPSAAAESSGPAQTPGTCEGGDFSALPPNGSTVAPGQLIIYRLEMLVGGDLPVLGCARDMWPSDLLQFVTVRPDGDYWPDTMEGSIAEVSFDGPIASGTRLTGWVVMRVRPTARPGSIIESRSLTTIRHRVAARQPHR